MKSTRIMLASVFVVVVVAAVFGFFVVFRSAPHAAYARLMIDAGTLIALLSIVGTQPKPIVLRTQEIIDALRQLAKGVTAKRLSNVAEFGELTELAQAVNELAGTIHDRDTPDTSQSRPAPRAVFRSEHSYHPELGPVQAVNFLTQIEAETAREAEPTPLPEPEHMREPAHITDIPSVDSDIPAPALERFGRVERFVSPPVLDTQALYNRYAQLLKEHGQASVEQSAFERTITDTRAALIEKHGCRAVNFDVVMDGNEVALRPRLIR